MQWRSWLRHCAPRRKVPGLILHGVTGILDLTIPAAIWPGVGSASNSNEYQGYLLGDKGGRYVRLTSLPPSCTDSVDIPRASTS